MQHFHDRLLDTDDFVLTFELVPERLAQSRRLERMLRFAERAAADGRLTALSITDLAGGNPALSPDVLGREILDLGIDVLIHFTTKDINRNTLQARALQLARMDLHNLLVMTGDAPLEGYLGRARPVFDLHAVEALRMLSGLDTGKPNGSGQSAFFTGSAISPFKIHAAEWMGQYLKLRRKVAAGARFAITQVGFDARKFAELATYVERAGLDVRLIGNVYLLSPPAARAMAEGRVPGAVVTRGLLAQVERDAAAPDGGKAARIERAARLLAVLKGLGYRGAHVGGHGVPFRDVATMLDRFEAVASRWQEFLPDFDWPQPKGTYLYAGDPVAIRTHPEEIPIPRRPAGREATAYRLMRAFHWMAFTKGGLRSRVWRWVARWADRSRIGRGLLHLVEDLPKLLMFECRRCGDCALPDLAYLCPESQCAKYLRNGPCGGSHDGRCEVWPDRPCIWVRVFERLHSVGRTEELADGWVPPRQWSLDRTSAWCNFWLERDHHGGGGDAP